MAEKKILNTKEAAEFLGIVSAKSLAKWRKLGKGPVFIKIEGIYGYRIEDLEKYLQDRTLHPRDEFAA